MTQWHTFLILFTPLSTIEIYFTCIVGGHWFWIISNAFNFKILFYSTKNKFQNSSSCSFRDNTILVSEWQMLNVFYRYIFMHEHENSTFTLIFKHWFLQAHNKFSFIYFLKYQVVWIFNKHVLVSITWKHSSVSWEYSV